MTRENLFVLVRNVIVGWLAASFVLGSAIGLNATLLVLVLAVLVWILIVAYRADVAYALLGVVVGFVLVVILPVLSADSLGSDSLIQGLGLLLFTFKA